MGSIPLDTVEEAFATFGATLGTYLRTLPDGETGPRSHWTGRIHYLAFAPHPDLEAVQRPSSGAGVGRLGPRDVGDGSKFRVRERVTAARRYLPDFGIGAYYGFGRLSPGEPAHNLADHVTAAGTG